MSGLLHQHGGNAELDFKRLGIAARDFIDFSVNVHPLGAPMVVRDNWQNALQHISHYPSQAGRGIQDFYHQRFGLNTECVLAGNGSIELIYLIPRALQLAQAIVFTPAFFDYANAAKQAGLKLKYYQLNEQNSFAYDFINLINDEPSLVFIGRPNNPTATLIQGEVILQLADTHPQHTFVLDEAFIQFTELWGDTLMAENRLRNNVIIVHSLTKFYSLAGLRAGALISTAQTIAKLATQQSPWAVNGICDYLMPLIAEDNAYEENVRKETNATKTALLAELAKLSSVKVYGTSANFLFVKWLASDNIDDLIAGLLKQGIYVRNCANYHGLAGNYFRIAIRNQADNAKLVLALTNLEQAQC